MRTFKITLSCLNDKAPLAYSKEYKIYDQNDFGCGKLTVEVSNGNYCGLVELENELSQELYVKYKIPYDENQSFYTFSGLQFSEKPFDEIDEVLKLKDIII